MKNLVLLALAIGGFSIGTFAQVDKKTKKEVVKVKQVKLPTETEKKTVQKPVQVKKQADVRVKKMEAKPSPKPVLKTPKKEVNLQRIEQSEIKAKPVDKDIKGLTKEKINHAEEKSNGKAFSGKGQDKKKQVKTKGAKKPK